MCYLPSNAFYCKVCKVKFQGQVKSSKTQSAQVFEVADVMENEPGKKQFPLVAFVLFYQNHLSS